MSSSAELHHVDNDEVDHPNGCNNISLLLGEGLERDSQLQEQLTSSSQQLRKDIWDGSTITLEPTDSPPESPSPPDSPSPSDSPSASPPQLPTALLSQVQCGVCLDYFSDSQWSLQELSPGQASKFPGMPKVQEKDEEERQR